MDATMKARLRAAAARGSKFIREVEAARLVATVDAIETMKARGEIALAAFWAGAYAETKRLTNEAARARLGA